MYIENDVACNIDNETIMQRFQNMKTVEGNFKLYVFVRFF